MKIQVDRKKWIFTGIMALMPVLMLCLILGLAELGLRLFAPQIYPVHPKDMYQLDEAVGYVLTLGYQGTLQRTSMKLYSVPMIKHCGTGPAKHRPTERGASCYWGTPSFSDLG